jgi:hypothetical protein
MGAGYFTVILASAMALRTPHPSYVVPGMEITSSSSAVAKVPDVTVDEAFKTPQFHLLGTAFFCVATGGMGLLSVAKPMMSDVFSTLLPALVTSAFASKYLLMLSAGNLGTSVGRICLRVTTFLSFPPFSNHLPSPRPYHSFPCYPPPSQVDASAGPQYPT